ncbi:MAG: sodium:solute symporter family transporter [Aureispira sp.]
MLMYLLFVLYSLFLIGLSYFYGRQATPEEYLLSGRNRPTLHILASKFAGAVGVSTFITYTSYAYKFSALGVVPLILGATVGYWGFAFWAAPKIKRFSFGQQFYTQGDLVRFITINENSRRLTNILTIGVQFFWVTLALVGGAKTIAYFNVLSYEVALLSTAIVLLFYLLLSGFKAVILTDVVQTVIILAFLAFLVFVILWNENVIVGELLQTRPPQEVGWGNIIGLLLYGGLSVFGLADRYQLCYAAKDEETAKRGMAFAVLPVLLVVFLLLLVGLSALAQTTTLNPDEAFLYAMEQFLSPLWYPLLLLLFFAGLMSSADTNIFAVASHAAFLSPAQDKVKATKQFTALVILIATLIAYFWRSIIDISVIGAALRVTLAIPMMYIISRGNNTGRFMTATLLGVLALIGGWVILGAEPVIIVLILLAGMLGMLYKSKNDERYWS